MRIYLSVRLPASQADLHSRLGRFIAQVVQIGGPGAQMSTHIVSKVRQNLCMALSMHRRLIELKLCCPVGRLAFEYFVQMSVKK